MFQTYTWRGQPINNIQEWAAERGERMVRYEARRTIPDLRTGGLLEEIEHGEMPESFWNGLLMSHGWSYKELA